MRKKAKKPGDLVEQLQRAIRDCPHSTYKICKESGTDRGNLSRFLLQGRGITLKTAAKLAEYLKLELVQRGR